MVGGGHARTTEEIGTDLPGRFWSAGAGKDPQRRRILDAMVAAVAERGYRETSIDDVLGRAGVSEETFSARFAGKEECFLAALDDFCGRLEHAIVASCARTASWSERLCVGLRTLLHELERDPQRTRLALAGTSDAGPAAMARLRRAYRAFVPFFDEGRRMVRHELPRPTADAVVGGIALTVQNRVAVAEGDLSSLDDLLPDLVYFALVPYVGPRRACALAGT